MRRDYYQANLSAHDTAIDSVRTRALAVQREAMRCQNLSRPSGAPPCAAKGPVGQRHTLPKVQWGSATRCQSSRAALARQPLSATLSIHSKLQSLPEFPEYAYLDRRNT